MTVIINVPFSWAYVSALMTYWWTTAFHLKGAFLPTRVSGVPMSKVSRWTFSFLIIPQSLSIYFKSYKPAYRLLAAVPLWILYEDKCVEKKGGWQACVTGERFTWGHKSQGERRGDTAYIKGSVYGDREVKWPSPDSPYTPPGHTPIHTLPSGRRHFSLRQNTSTPLDPVSHSPCCFQFPLANI